MILIRPDAISGNPPSCSVRSASRETCVAVWIPAGNTCPETKIGYDFVLRKPIVVGRANGQRVEYLDPSYQATNFVPGSHQSVLLGEKQDNLVSRGHFTIKPTSNGVYFINGVPGLDGTIRPPTNWTCVLTPVERLLEPREEFIIEADSSVLVRLPNESVIEIRIGY